MTSDGIMKEVEARGPSREDINKSESEDTQAEILLTSNMQRGVAEPSGSQTQSKVKVTGVMDDMSDISIHLKKLCENLTKVINSYTNVNPVFRDALQQHASVENSLGNMTEETEEEMKQNFMYLDILHMMDKIKWINSAMENIKASEDQKKSKKTNAENESHCENVKINSVTSSVPDMANTIMRSEEDVEKKKTDECHRSSIDNLMKEKDESEDRRVTCSKETTEEIYEQHDGQEVEKTMCNSPSVVTSHGSDTKMNEQSTNSKVPDTQGNKEVSDSMIRHEGEDESEKRNNFLVSQKKKEENELEVEGEFKDEIEEQAEGKLEFESKETSDWKDNDEERVETKSERVDIDENLQWSVRFNGEMEVNVKAPIVEESDQEGKKKQHEFKVASEEKNQAEPGEEVRDDGQGNIEDKGEGEINSEEDGKFESEREDKIMDVVIKDLEIKDTVEGRAESEDKIETKSEIQDEVKEEIESKATDETKPEEEKGIKSEVEGKIEDEVTEDLEKKDVEKGRAEAEDKFEAGSNIQDEVKDLENKRDDERSAEAEGEISFEVKDKFQDGEKEKYETETEVKDVSADEGRTQKVKDDFEMKCDEEGRAEEEIEIKSEVEDKIQNEVNEELEDNLEGGKEFENNLKVKVADSVNFEIEDDARQVKNGAAESKVSIKDHNIQEEELGENKDEKECKVEDDVEVEGEVRRETEDEIEVEVKMKNQEEDSNPIECDAIEISLKSEIGKDIELIDKEKTEDESEAEIKGKGEEEEREDMPDFKGKVDSEVKIEEEGQCEVEVDIKIEGEEEFKGESQAEAEAQDESSIKHTIEGNGKGEDERNKELDRDAWSNDKYSEKYREMSSSETRSGSLGESEEKDKKMEGDTKVEKESPETSSQRRESKYACMFEGILLESLDETSTRTIDDIDSDLSWQKSLCETDVDTSVPKGLPMQRVSKTSSDLKVVSQSFQSESQDEALSHLQYDISTDEPQASPRNIETSLDQRGSIVKALRHGKKHEGTKTSQQSPKQSLGETCVLEAQKDQVGVQTETSSSLLSLRRQMESQVLKEPATLTLTRAHEEAAYKVDYSMLHTSSMIPGYSSRAQTDPQRSHYHRQERYGVKLPSVHDGKKKNTISRAKPSSTRYLLDDPTLPYVNEIRTLVRNLGYSHQFVFALTGSRLHRPEQKNNLRFGHLYKSPLPPSEREDPTYSKLAVDQLEKTLLLLQHNRLPLEAQHLDEPSSVFIRKKAPPKLISRGMLPPLRQGKYLIQQCVDCCKCRHYTDECSHLANHCNNWSPEHLEISCDDFVQSILLYQIPDVRRLEDNFLFLHNNASLKHTANPQKFEKTKSRRRTFSPKLPPFKDQR